MSTKIKVLISVLAIVLCVGATTTTLVLTLGDNDGGHVDIEQPSVSADELDITLLRERLESLTLNKNGLPVKRVDDKTKDFTRIDDNIFGMDDDVLIQPQCYFSADMAVKNNKPYAFSYSLEIVPQGSGNLLAEQLKLTVVVDGVTVVERTLQNGLSTEYFSVNNNDKTSRFTVTLEYLDLEDNDLTKNTTLAFDMIVHAKSADNQQEAQI